MTQQKSTTSTLYDHADSVSAQRPQPARALVPKVSESAEAQLYGFSSVASEVESRGGELWAVTGATEAEQRRTRDLFVDIAKSGVPEGVVLNVARQFIDGELAFARETTDAAAVAEMERRVSGGNERTREALRQQYSERDGEKMLERVQRYVRSRPKLAGVLEQHGLGSRPDIVMGLAAHVFSTGWR